MKLIVTIPAYNEGKTIKNVIRGIIEELKKQDYSFLVLVLDDGSTDNTAKIAKQQGAEVISFPRNRGLAETFKSEMKECLKRNPDIIVHTDADGQYLASEISKLVKEIENGNDLVLGSRFKGKIEKMPFIKRLGNITFSKVISKVSGIPISDAQTGFRAFTKEIAKIEIKSDYTYTQEQVIRAAKAGFRIKEIPIYFAKRGEKTKSRLMKGPFDYAIRAGINLLRVYRDYKPLSFFGLFGGAFFLMGLILGVWILYTYLESGVVGGIPRVILSVLFIIMGIQICLFGFLADMNKR